MPFSRAVVPEQGAARCLLTGSSVTPLFEIERFPVLASVTLRPPTDDVFFSFRIGIGDESGLVQQLSRPPADVLYEQPRNSAVGGLWRRHHLAFADYVKGRACLDNQSVVADVGSGSGF